MFLTTALSASHIPNAIFTTTKNKFLKKCITTFIPPQIAPKTLWAICPAPEKWFARITITAINAIIAIIIQVNGQASSAALNPDCAPLQ